MASISALVAAVLLAPVIAADEIKAPRNVVLVVADDLGLQLGCYGDAQAKTPALDRLAREGTRFLNAYCTTSSCSACRSVLLTGLYNHATGHYGHEHGYNHFSTYGSVVSLPLMLAKAGYRTCSIGKMHVAPEAVYHFERYLNEGIQGGRNAVRMAENARAFMAEADPRPFFLYFCPTDPHRSGGGDDFANFPNQPERYAGVTPVRFDPQTIKLPPWLPDLPECRREWAAYYQAASRFDQGLGRLLDAIRETGHEDDTLVIVLSDNGPPFPGAKTTMYEPGVRLPLIVRQPGTSGAVVSRALVTWADVTPTILDFTKTPPPDAPPVRPSWHSGAAPKAAPRNRSGAPAYSFHGRSILAAVGKENVAGFDEVYLSHTFHEVTMYYPMRSVIEGNRKYILNLAHPLPFPFASDLYESATWQAVLKRNESMYGVRAVSAYVQRPRHELYDLEADPNETKNLADDPAHAAELARLQAKLKEWQTKTGDPWLLKYTYE